MVIKPQAIWLRGGVRVEIFDHHLNILENGVLHLIHMTRDGEVLRITRMDVIAELKVEPELTGRIGVAME